MYEAFYGLTEKPFSILPDPYFLYWAEAHSMAYAMLEYGIMNQAGFTVISGEIGSGKTTLVRQLLAGLDQRITVGLVSNFMPGSGRLMEWILMSFSQPFESTSYVALFRQLQEFLIAEYRAGKHTLLIIDEAQNLPPEALEELRMLSNSNADQVQLLQLILVGQPQLRDILKRPELFQFAQRVSSDFHLMPLSEAEVSGYIEHRLSIAGAWRSLFSANACQMIAQASRGIPRTVNILCDTALVYGFSKRAKTITARIVEHVLEDKRQYGLFQTDYPSPRLVGKDLPTAN
jgi:type II secretory pathway predicted ATPase ExeA